MGLKISSTSELVVKQLNDNPSTLKTKNKETGKSHGKGNDTADVGMGDLYKSLTALAGEIKTKLEDILGSDLPKGGLESLKPEDFTPEKTADMIVSGTTAMLSIYAKQNPNMQGEELISSFMKTIRGGINEGYQQASAILGDIGAFKFDGVKDGISKTMDLVEQKLSAFEADWRKQHLGTEEADATEEPESREEQSQEQSPE
ncbi:MAG: DUF5610 domain-containing protein [Deltaproteobacteria bacterium]|nr:DUF5610 domain-containing protein [Deltaproteobacteria bacterium]